MLAGRSFGLRVEKEKSACVPCHRLRQATGSAKSKDVRGIFLRGVTAVFRLRQGLGGQARRLAAGQRRFRFLDLYIRFGKNFVRIVSAYILMIC